MTTKRFLFQRILDEGVETGFTPGASEESRQWFRDKAGQLRDIRPDRLMRSKGARDNTTSRLFHPGDMYLFKYEARDKDTLPYYDKFPLIMLIEDYPGGFMGVNFHYLPARLRAVLMTQMYEYLSDERFDEKTRLKFTYQQLKTLSGQSLWKPCIKRYLNNQCKSRFVKIHPAEWDIVLQLPLDRFVGARRSTVYKDSRQKSGR